MDPFKQSWYVHQSHETNLMKRKVHKSETQVKWAGQQLQSSNFANAFVQEIPRKEVTILFRTRKLKIHDLRVLS